MQMLVEHKQNQDEITPLPKTDDEYAFDEDRLESMRVNMLDAGYTLEEAEDETKQARAQQWRTYRLPETYPTLRIGQPPIDLVQKNVDRVEVWVEEAIGNFSTGGVSRWGKTYEEFQSNAEQMGLKLNRVASDYISNGIENVAIYKEWIPLEEEGSKRSGCISVRYDFEGNIEGLNNTVQSTFNKSEIDQYVKSALEQNKNITKLEIKITDDHVDMRSVGDIPFERIRRITGYLVGNMDKWNDAKTVEESQRVKHGLTQLGELDKKAAEAKVSSSALNQNNNQIIEQMKGVRHER